MVGRTPWRRQPEATDCGVSPAVMDMDMDMELEMELEANSSLLDNDTATLCPTFSSQMPLLIAQMFLYVVVCIVGLLGNTLVIYVVIRFSKMQTVTNMYIVNLAIADEFFLVGIPFLLVTMHFRRWVFGDIMCKFYLISTSINQFTSTLFLFVMSADRYIAVCHPISSPKWRTPFISRLVSALAWVLSGLFVVPVLMHARQIRHGDYHTCNIFWSDSWFGVAAEYVFTLYSFIVGFVTPLIFIFIFYFLVVRKLKTVGPKNKSKEKKRSHRKVTKLVLTVVTVYVMCWLPYWISQVALIFSSSDKCHSHLTLTIYLLTSCLSYSNSAMNPILYAFLSDNFKKSFLKACTCTTGRDVNAALHMENSVFPRRHKAGSDKSKAATLCPRTDADDDEGEDGPLVSKGDPSTSAITMTSRSNITVTTLTTDSRDGVVLRNGILVTAQPTHL